MRFFGVLCLKSDYTGYSDMVGLRNSHDRRFPVGVSFGCKCFVCDNLAFSGDHVIKRKHTVNLKRDLPGIIGELIEPLAIQREAQKRQFDRYQATMLTDDQRRPGHHADVPQPGHRRAEDRRRTGAVGSIRVHDWGDKTGW